MQFEDWQKVVLLEKTKDVHYTRFMVHIHFIPAYFQIYSKRMTSIQDLIEVKFAVLQCGE